MSLTTFCIKVGGQCAPLPPSELLHLNQAGVKHFISNLRDAKICAFRDFHKGAASSSPAVTERKRKRALGLRMPLPLP